MANYRNVSMAFWSDPKIVDDFTPEDRYIYLYCMTNPHTNLCGCYELSIKQISQETGYTEDAIKHILQRLDSQHQVIRYSATTKELLLLNWYRYNWSASDRLDKPLLEGIRAVKCDRFRAYLADRYNERTSVATPYEYDADSRPDVPREQDSEIDLGTSGATQPKKNVRHKYGQYGWVRLSDAEYERLRHDIGDGELGRCIRYIDESAQANGNKYKWKDWNLVIRRCFREGWGLDRQATARNASRGAMEDLRELHRKFEEGSA